MNELKYLRGICNRKNNQKIIEEKIILVERSIRHKQETEKNQGGLDEYNDGDDIRKDNKLRIEVPKYDWSQTDDTIMYIILIL